MSARMQVLGKFKGVPVYLSANTHPAAKTTSLAVFTGDIPGYQSIKGINKITRFRYTRGDGQSFTDALVAAYHYINEHITEIR